jgi:hypothetical protein
MPEKLALISRMSPGRWVLPFEGSLSARAGFG